MPPFLYLVIAMDPISQAVLGAAVPQATARPLAKSGKPATLGQIGLIGALAGMAPDLDVLIRSSMDPLLFLEFHRQFTHSLIFIPFGALICAAAFYPFFKRTLTFKSIWWVALLGYGTHGLLDACTTYGTLLFWPFSYARIAWNNVSVIDPLATLPLLVAVVMAGRRNNRRFAIAGLVWFLCYLGLGAIQAERARTAGEALAASRGHTGVDVSAKASFGNLVLWKVIYQYEGQYHVDAVRAFASVSVIEGDRITGLDLARDFPWLDDDSQQARDVARFNWFSSGALAVDRDDSNLIVDLRYSLLPNQIKGLWGIRLNPEAPADAHVEWVSQRSGSQERLAELWQMITGG